MPYLLARDIDGTRYYWTGKTGPHGGPSRSPWKSDGYHFSTATGARECADTHRDLKDSDQWKVVPR